MKKWLIFGIFWLLWQIPFAADPQLVEARRYTSKQESRQETRYCNEKGNCSTGSSFLQSKQWSTPQNNNFGGGGYYYAPSPSSGGGNSPQINVPIDFKPIANALECLITIWFGGCRSLFSQQPTSPPKLPELKPEVPAQEPWAHVRYEESAIREESLGN
ncbi:hypothetical protein A3G55_02100 [Candidatus Giovannonibacteria bacterium RIFCSPLOWO2_12_FULL_44_25]|uniref:Uncharacterized protein n=3 Tax=Candidatus Giovannoniibacteriota TaxID=1752738 RepID=A0A0G1KKQ1_9BACT|nr:MAG: hypothetical protein UW15_C0007G0008 [Parcubacteria group bacterium GW2011_GWC1_44_10]KKT56872.1 MAG: hypothetical protein UW49_C0012G0008 [Candidatus Giovannonibacteria bacterium GW2011_GWB1_44_23]KKT59441.1 MAG: hypothetical protein UW53_C0012G0008 [Candidatus Giovannonibacteria bacterium GW2011_GWA1_44_25]OGF49589.1 MAG: hypothetical protein A2120_04225 [Candidatus Giovannonibacteria bacterium GWA2_45_15]OGF59899.1 MAG: hypothetical protein A2W40_02225 [Candidatus Giovannonibacteria 